MPSMNYYKPSRRFKNRRFRVNVCEGSVHISQEEEVGRGKWARVGEAGTLGELTREEAEDVAALILDGLSKNF